MLNIEEQTKYALIDSLLDSYNENMTLFRLFGDFVYQERAEHFMGLLKSHFKRDTDEE
ncbi:hypothetical protein [Ammoniphilus sp. YIM 78166]|uniref:hypothetical protein n=1 Tax=Ammoniphilus sp. YIM 78166 TaxID=1644106 RepID=UPI001431620B|nr:hypothetical protein [Ammoniphilus sp. YIM 78166]